MEKIRELIDVLEDQTVKSRSYLAKRDLVCKICGKSADTFRTPFSELEYRISAICQACRDYYFPGED